MCAFKFIHKTFLNIDPCLIKPLVSQNTFFHNRKCAGNSKLYKSNTILFMCIALQTNDHTRKTYLTKWSI